jgi:hypothetical protein
MVEFFSNLIVSDFRIFFLKILLFPLITFLLTVLISIVWIKIEKSKIDFILHSKIILLKSIIMCVFLLNFFWIFLIKSNGIYLFFWSDILEYKTNILFRMSPLILSYSLLLFTFFRIHNQIKKLL